MQPIDQFDEDICYIQSQALNIKNENIRDLKGEELALRVNRIGTVIAKADDISSLRVPNLSKDLQIIITTFTKMTWTQEQIEQRLPLHLEQGIHSCLNILKRSVPHDALSKKCFHGSILKYALAAKQGMAEGKTPQECVRKYCLDVLHGALNLYPGRPLYFLRESSSVSSCSDGDALQLVVLSLAKKSHTPLDQDDVKHCLLAYNPVDGTWFHHGNPKEKHPSLDAIISATVPRGTYPLKAPTPDEQYDYVLAYGQGGQAAFSSYKFLALTLDSDLTPSEQEKNDAP